MNAIDLLKDHHREIEILFEQLELAQDSEEKQVFFEELADNLAAHAAIEEQIFYPAAFAKATEKALGEAVEEHLAQKRLIADLMVMSPDHEQFDAKLAVLREQVEHHVDEEENTLFPLVRQHIEVERLRDLGMAMMELFEEEMSGEPSEAIPGQIGEAAPLR